MQLDSTLANWREKMLLRHLDGCTPLQPCGACNATRFLREKLKSEDFDKFLSLLEGRVISASDPFGESIDGYEFSVRTSNALKNAGILTLRQLLGKTEHELLHGPNFGRKSLNEVKEVLSSKGYRLGQLVEVQK